MPSRRFLILHLVILFIVFASICFNVSVVIFSPHVLVFIPSVVEAILLLVVQVIIQLFMCIFVFSQHFTADYLRSIEHGVLQSVGMAIYIIAAKSLFFYLYFKNEGYNDHFDPGVSSFVGPFHMIFSTSIIAGLTTIAPLLRSFISYQHPLSNTHKE